MSRCIFVPIARAAGLLFAFLGSMGCERKAPGPEECLQFADVWMRAERAGRQPRLAVEDAFDELVRRCLTEPYDRELVSCVVRGSPRDRCRVDFARRLTARHEERTR